MSPEQAEAGPLDARSDTFAFGATMYELMAGAEGWPATDWLTPWQPPADRP